MDKTLEALVEKIITRLTPSPGDGSPEIARDARHALRHAKELAAALATREEDAEIVTLSLWCPDCGQPHVDEGEWETRPHKTHQCQACGHEWRPFDYPTVGVPHIATHARQDWNVAETAYESGWRNCAKWADRNDLHADIGSPAYIRDRNAALTTGGRDDE